MHCTGKSSGEVYCTGWRRCGVGSSLLELVERAARGRSPMVELHVHNENKDAQLFYEAQGFTPCGAASATSLVMRRRR